MSSCDRKFLPVKGIFFFRQKILSIEGKEHPSGSNEDDHAKNCYLVKSLTFSNSLKMKINLKIIHSESPDSRFLKLDNLCHPGKAPCIREMSDYFLSLEI